ncbi:MAG: hypothetical protein LBD17_02110, partial [Endomicrobium sp.]|nr:hypothetical protein [Endomicrobium sp.]
DKKNYKLDVFIAFENKFKFTSPCCKAENCNIDSKEAKVWRILGILDYETFIHLDVPNLKCPKCGKIIAYQIDWDRPSC